MRLFKLIYLASFSVLGQTAIMSAGGDSFSIGYPLGYELISSEGITLSVSNNSKVFKVYPNPFIDYVYFKGFKKESLILIYNINGNLLKRIKMINKLYLGDLPKGFYLLNIENTTYKLLKR